MSCVSLCLLSLSPFLEKLSTKIDAQESYNFMVVVSFCVLVLRSLYGTFFAWLENGRYKEQFAWEKKRETWELENFPEGEIQEMAELYVEKGMAEDDAKLVVSTMSKYNDFFVNVMMLEELGMLDPEDRSPKLLPLGLCFLTSIVPGAFSLGIFCFLGLVLWKGTTFSHAPALLVFIVCASCIAALQNATRNPLRKRLLGFLLVFVFCLVSGSFVFACSYGLATVIL